MKAANAELITFNHSIKEFKVIDHSIEVLHKLNLHSIECMCITHVVYTVHVQITNIKQIFYCPHKRETGVF